VLANEGSDLSAHETLERAQSHVEDFTALAAEYETLARAAQEQRWSALLERSGLDPVQLEQVRRSKARGTLLAALRTAEARGLDVEGAFPKLVALRSLDDAEDPASVMHARVEDWAQTAGPKRRTGTGFVAGIVPRASASPIPTWSAPSLNESVRCGVGRESSPCTPSSVARFGYSGSALRRSTGPNMSGGSRPSRASPPTGSVGTSATIGDPSDPGAPSGRSMHLVTDGAPNSPSQEALRLSNGDREHRRPQLSAMPAEPVWEFPARIEL